MSSNSSLGAAFVNQYGSAFEFDQDGTLQYEVSYAYDLVLVTSDGAVLCRLKIRPVLLPNGEEITEVNR
ncbi:MAG: hypothetical protein ACE5H4_07340 [Candidatus Thorarchaeota archaeon]